MSKRKPPREFSTRHRRRSKDTPQSGVRLHGIHAVTAALANPKRKLFQLYISHNAARDFSPDPLPAPCSLHDPRELDRLVPQGTVHQGVIADFSHLPETNIETLDPQNGPVIILDQVTDPHNVGAIMRSAAVFGAQGLVITRHNSPPQEGILAKTASGALEHVPLISVTNLARSIETLKMRGFFVYGLDELGTPINKLAGDLSAPALVLGAEGAGLRRLTRDHCDAFISLTSGNSTFTTLNVSNAAAVALFALTRK